MTVNISNRELRALKHIVSTATGKAGGDEAPGAPDGALGVATTGAAATVTTVGATAAATVEANAALGAAASGGLVNGVTIAGSGTYDPSVSGLAATRPALYVRDTEYLPKSLAKLNEILSPYGATAAHAWDFQEASGNAVDLATSGAIPLVPTGVAQNVSTSLTDYVTDKAAQFTAGSGHKMAAAAAASLDVAAGSMFLMGTFRIPTAPGSTQTIYSKCAAAYARFQFLQVDSAGRLIWTIKDADTDTQILTGAVNVTGATYIDFLAIADRTNTPLLALTTSAEDVGTASLAAVTGSLSTATLAGFGESAIGDASAGFILTFAAWGTVVGTLVADRVAALAAYSSARAAGAQIWAKRGAANTAWSKVNA